MNINPFDKFNKQWALVTAGNHESFNSMTISWGSMGTIWGKDIITIYIRPERYTFEFLEKNDTFTISFYDEKYRKALDIMGTLSGKNTDKVKEADLTPVSLEDSMTYKEANETYLCKKIYMDQIDKTKLPENLQKFYEDKKTHYIILGEVIKES